MDIHHTIDRRHFLSLAGAAALGAAASRAQGEEREKEADVENVTANEDLMREHGVIRRALLVYAEAARRARAGSPDLPLASLAGTAELFRRFAEDYHERALEEAHIFPVVRKAKGEAARLPDVLVAQHRRGREITDYVLRVARGTKLGPAHGAPLADALDGLVRMNEPHAAREDTLLFPAWKAALGARAYAEMGERFEEIERRTFGHDGFDDALAEIARIESAFGLSDLAAMTAAAPPVA